MRAMCVTFDQFADYDTRMRRALAYRAPEISGRVGAMVSGGRMRKTPTLDLGCRHWPRLRPPSGPATTLTGIDLSLQMIAGEGGRASTRWRSATSKPVSRPRGGASPRRMAADVFVYLGDLGAVFAGVQRVLEAGRPFPFTVERHEGEAPFVLQETRRWAHGRGYVEEGCGGARLGRAGGSWNAMPRVGRACPSPGLAGALTPILGEVSAVSSASGIAG